MLGIPGGARNRQPFLWLLWHPHQRIWNRQLTDRVRQAFPMPWVQKPLLLVIVWIDSLALFLRALWRRARSLGAFSLFTVRQVPQHIKVIYLDVGTHRDGRELALMADNFLPSLCAHWEAFAFEANRDSFETVRRRFSHQPRISIRHLALCKDIPSCGILRLYTGGDGLADSLYRKNTKYQEVHASRLSDFMIENGMMQANLAILLRMNIEGAEFDVLLDLVERQLAQRINGYYGMWDDLSKIDIARDKEFRSLLKSEGVSPFTFNDRDLKFRWRRFCIKYDMRTQLLRALDRRV